MDVREAMTFEACYARHRATVYRLCLRYGGGRATWAEDVTHDVFVKLLEHLPRLTAHDDVGGWLYRVATNLCLNRLRGERSFVRTMGQLLAGPEPHEPGSDVLFEQKEEARVAMQTLQSLPPREQVVLCMKLLDGKSQKDISTTLSLSEGYVSKLLTRAWIRVRAAGWAGEEGADVQA